MPLARFFPLLIAAALLSACETAPVTGRKELMLVSESDAINASSQAYQQVMAHEAGKINTDPALEARVRKITGRLVAQAEKYRPETAKWQWQVAVIDEPQTVNAWAMAGGKMAIYTGIINKLQLTDDEMAQIMGHEIAHALAKHTAERMSTAAAQQLGLQLAAAIFGTQTAGAQLGLQAAALATTVGYELPHSRTQEAEADRIGIELAAKAGYDPHAAVTLWQKMIQVTGGGKSDFLSDHPASEKRLQTLAGLVPQMMPYYQDPSPRPVAPVALLMGQYAIA
jgi:predicted Zn-dependent protease